MTSVQEILKTKMCRDTISIVLDYLNGDKGYWKGMYNENMRFIKCLIKEGSMFDKLLKMFIKSRERHARIISNDFKRMFGTTSHFECIGDLLFSHITDKNKLVIIMPNGKKKYASLHKVNGFGVAVFTHKNKFYGFYANSPEAYMVFPTQYDTKENFVWFNFGETTCVQECFEWSGIFNIKYKSAKDISTHYSI